MNLADSLLEGFVGFDDIKTRSHLAHNIHSLPTTGELKLPDGKIVAMTVISKNPVSALEIDQCNIAQKISSTTKAIFQ